MFFAVSGYKFMKMLPQGFKQRIKDQKYIDAENLFRALEEPSPSSIRINLTKWNRTPVNARKIPWCKSGFYLSERPSFTLDPLFHSGCYYPQEASGMFLEHIMRNIAGSMENICVLDLCGAPGGKSTHLSDIIGPDNLLVANEVIRSRAVILAETITKWGSGNTLVTQNDPAQIGRLSGYFDIILVDAPCSGEGMFRNDEAIKEWSVNNTSYCSERQKRILMDIWPSLKENGILIYSTCTFNPGENEENIKWLINKHEAECIRIDIKGIKGITEIDYQGIYGYGFYPDKIMGEGLFISVIRKTVRQEKSSFRNRRIIELKPDKTALSIALNLADISKERLIKWGDEIISVPGNMADYLLLFQNMKIVKAGIKVVVIKKNNFRPSHDLILSNRLRKDALPQIDLNLTDAISYLRRDIVPLKDAAKGWNIISYKGINLGLVKNIGHRVNNYFPVEWRIRMDIPERGVDSILEWDL